MPFEEVVERISAKPQQPPCTMRLKKRSAAGRPSCLVTMRQTLMEKLSAAWQKGGQVGVAFGTGEDAGKMRIVLKRSGAFTLRILKHSGQLDLGYVQAFGEEPKVAAEAKYEVTGGQALILTIPNWTEVETDTGQAGEEDEDPPEEPAATAPKRMPIDVPAMTLKGGAAPKPAEEHLREPVAKNGIRVAFGIPPAKPIIYGPKGEHELSPRQADILAVLVNGAGGVMPTSEITSRAKLAPGAGASIISDAFIALERPLKEIGLTLKYVNKLGYSINKAG